MVMELPKQNTPESIPWIKRKRLLYIWVKLAWSLCLAPLKDSSAFLQMLSFPIFIFLVLENFGLSKMTEEIAMSAIAVKSIFIAVPLFVAWNFISAAFKAKDKAREAGRWFGGTFAYNERQLVTRFRVNNSNNNKLHSFEVPQAEEGGYAEFEIELGGFERRRVRASIITEISKDIITPYEHMQQGDAHSLSLVFKSKTFYLNIQCETQNISQVSVYLISWSAY